MGPAVVNDEITGEINLREWLAVLGVKQSEVARESSTTAAFINDVTHGRRRLTPRVREAMTRIEARRKQQARTILGLDDRTGGVNSEKVG